MHAPEMLLLSCYCLLRLTDLKQKMLFAATSPCQPVKCYVFLWSQIFFVLCEHSLQNSRFSVADLCSALKTDCLYTIMFDGMQGVCGRKCTDLYPMYVCMFTVSTYSLTCWCLLGSDHLWETWAQGYSVGVAVYLPCPMTGNVCGLCA